MYVYISLGHPQLVYIIIYDGILFYHEIIMLYYISTYMFYPYPFYYELLHFVSDL